MGFDRTSASILVLLSLPFQFNIITDSFSSLHTEMIKKWTPGKDFSYYENYFANKITYYAGLISSISFIFVYYRYRKMKLVLSITLFLNGVTWLLYLAVDEHKVPLFIVIRGLQGLYLGIFQMSQISYILHFAYDEIKCFCGCLSQVAMFTGLLITNLLFNFCSWQAVVIILAAQSILFCGAIWLVPEYHIKPKSITHEYIWDKGNIKKLLIALLIMLLQQLSGIGTLLGQVSRLLSGVGLNIGNYLESCLFDFVGGLSTMVAAFITDYIGTRYMWSFSAFGLFIGLIVYAITLKVSTPNWAGTLGAFIYFLFYGLGEGPIPWFICGTIFPETVRIESSAIVLFENFFLSPILDLLWENLNSLDGQFGSIIFSAIICFLAIFLGFLIPKDSHEENDGINVL